ncbi:BON domain-containing protein [Candidatus Dojkabacteria bacterium]|nr:BON domain-containing protein [Candidatus Dojkabacteria bacterium]
MTKRKQTTKKSVGVNDNSGIWQFISVILFIILVGWIGFYFRKTPTEPEVSDVNISVVEPTDEEIQETIVSQLVWDSRVFSDNVDVSVTDGEVTLTGAVPNYESKKAAAQSALDVEGVISVDNEIIVEFPDISEIPEDEILQERVSNLLAWDSDLESYDIDVSVEDGNVTLTGTVDSFWRKNQAEEQAYSSYGVHNVDNQLAIVFTEDYTDENIAEDIMEALERNAIIDEEDVVVKVTDGHVTLTGKVDTAYESSVSTDIAFYTLGVKSVTNRLEVL